MQHLVASILVAATAGFATGAAWYLLLGRLWRQAAGIGAAEGRPGPLPFVAGLAANLLTAALLYHILAGAGVAGAGAGLVAGLGTGVCFAAPWLLTSYAFARRPLPLCAIDAGHAALAPAAIGLVLGLLA